MKESRHTASAGRTRIENMLSARESASVRKRLKDAFASQMQLAPHTERHLSGALQDTLQRPGSMVRAEIAYRLGLSSGLDDRRSEWLAISIEYFHTASLLFDDLPSMDNATHRRGNRCVHQIFGEGTAILAALALINRAYALLWKMTVGLSPEVQARSLAYVECHLGVSGVLNGQSRDLHYSAAEPSLRVPQQVAMQKTVSLIRLAFVLPAMAAGAPIREIHSLDRLAVSWGLSYQTLDDLKDILHTTGQGGKTTARDAHLDRPNLALSVGVAESLNYLRRLMNIGDKIVLRLGGERKSFDFLTTIREQLDREIASLAGAKTAVNL